MNAHALKRVFLTTLPTGAGSDSAPADIPVTTVRDASVIELKTKRAQREDRQPVDGADPDSREGRLAQIVQSLYMDRDRTLTDPKTAVAHDIALGVALLILDGAHATGQVDTDAHARLRAMLCEAQKVPDLL